MDEIKKIIKHIGRRGRTILIFFEDGDELPDYVDKYWNSDALDNLVDRRCIDWTGTSYKLISEGQELAQHLYKSDSESRQISAKMNPHRLQAFRTINNK
jgi:hypothetical protein